MGRKNSKPQKRTNIKRLVMGAVALAVGSAILFSCSRKKEPQPVHDHEVTQETYSSPLPILPIPPRHAHYSSSLKAVHQPQKAPAAKKSRAESTQNVAPGTVAIIIDDMGKNVSEVTQLMEPGIPLTFSVIPGLAKDKAVAEAAHDRGFHVMTHMPMEPLKYSGKGLEGNGLLISQDDGEIANRAKTLLSAIPFSEGANNHMGSRFTSDPEKMKVVMREVKKQGIFFIDSKTSPKSIAAQTATEMGVKEASRDVFLDNVQDVEAIKKQLDVLASTARKKGHAIAICHPHPTTIQALQEYLPKLKSDGITFVYVSDLVH